jgi:hypothetical protein
MNMQLEGFIHSWKVVDSLRGDMTVYRMFIFELGLLSRITEGGVGGY